jgi:hypothetical protein
MERRKRRSFTSEFRAEAGRLVREGSKNLPQVAKDLDLTDSLVSDVSAPSPLLDALMLAANRPVRSKTDCYS